MIYKSCEDRGYHAILVVDEIVLNCCLPSHSGSRFEPLTPRNRQPHTRRYQAIYPDTPRRLHESSEPADQIHHAEHEEHKRNLV
jgi:hypothetical protein